VITQLLSSATGGAGGAAGGAAHQGPAGDGARGAVRLGESCVTAQQRSSALSSCALRLRLNAVSAAAPESSRKLLSSRSMRSSVTSRAWTRLPSRHLCHALRAARPPFRRPPKPPPFVSVLPHKCCRWELSIAAASATKAVPDYGAFNDLASGFIAQHEARIRKRGQHAACAGV
jgi:hypothetical protein